MRRRLVRALEVRRFVVLTGETQVVHSLREVHWIRVAFDRNVDQGQAL